MMLINGEIIDSNTEDKYIDRLYDSCVNTLNQSQPVTPEIVISACDRLYQKVMDGEFDSYILPALQTANITYERFQELAKLFSKEELEYKCKIELGEWADEFFT